MTVVYLLFEGSNNESVGGVNDLTGLYPSLDAAQAAASDRYDWADILEIVDGRPGRCWCNREVSYSPGRSARWVWILSDDPWTPPPAWGREEDDR